jgi:hypothetical protein
MRNHKRNKLPSKMDLHGKGVRVVAAVSPLFP